MSGEVTAEEVKPQDDEETSHSNDDKGDFMGEGPRPTSSAAVTAEGSATTTTTTASTSAEATPNDPPHRGKGGTAIIVPFRDLHPEQNRAAHLQAFIDRVPRCVL